MATASTTRLRAGLSRAWDALRESGTLRPPHRQLDEAELEAAGVRAGTIRLSIGIEDVDDLVWDLEQGFARVRAVAPVGAAR